MDIELLFNVTFGSDCEYCIAQGSVLPAVTATGKFANKFAFVVEVAGNKVGILSSEAKLVEVRDTIVWQ